MCIPSEQNNTIPNMILRLGLICILALTSHTIIYKPRF